MHLYQNLLPARASRGCECRAAAFASRRAPPHHLALLRLPLAADRIGGRVVTDYYSQHFSEQKWGGPPMSDAVREGERIGNAPNRWHLVAEDTGIGDVVTACGRHIDRSVAHTASREAIEREKETSRVRRCKRCWS
jgi:hypothetical protein